MKVNRILFILAGIIKSVVAGFCALIVLLIFALKTVLKEVFLKSYEIIENLVKELSTDSEYAYLLDNTKEQNIDFVIDILDKFCLAVFIWVLIVVAIAVFNFLYAKKCKYASHIVDWKSITLVVVSWLCPITIVSSVLTTIAVFYKKKNNLHSDDVIEIEEK